MKLSYWKSPHGNVGDDLNGWLWPRVFGPEFFSPQDRPAAGFFGIGSVLDQRVERPEGSLLFGPGMRGDTGYCPPPEVEIRFVRGPRSAAALAAAGRPGVRYISDPAILTPLFAGPGPAPEPGRIGFIPYYATPEPLARQIAGELGLHLLPVTQEVEPFLEGLRRCEKVVTEAMHGAILADAFRIPWISCRLLSGVNEGPTSAFKWADWRESLGLPEQMHNAVPAPVYQLPGRVRRRLSGLIAARALPCLRRALAEDRWSLSADQRLQEAQQQILAEAAQLRQDRLAA